LIIGASTWRWESDRGDRTTLESVTTADRTPEVGVRERAGVALLRLATDLARQRQILIHGVSVRPAGHDRDRALTDLSLAAWPEAVLMWLGWRLLPRDTLSRRAASPTP